jgi:hypothetical protein
MNSHDGFKNTFPESALVYTFLAGCPSGGDAFEL